MEQVYEEQMLLTQWRWLSLSLYAPVLRLRTLSRHASSLQSAVSSKMMNRESLLNKTYSPPLSLSSSRLPSSANGSSYSNSTYSAQASETSWIPSMQGTIRSVYILFHLLWIFLRASSLRATCALAPRRHWKLAFSIGICLLIYRSNFILFPLHCLVDVSIFKI